MAWRMYALYRVPSSFGNVLTIGTTTKQEEYMNIFTFLFLNYHNGISRILECPI